jgi:hypothetical protein
MGVCDLSILTSQRYGKTSEENNDVSPNEGCIFLISILHSTLYVTIHSTVHSFMNRSIVKISNI